MLAIVIPFYKINFFEATLKSLVAQTDSRFKVYIGDDASPYDCSVLLNKYKDSFDFVYKRFETNVGGYSLVKQWERCLKLIEKEEWVLILGDDDILGENVVSSFYVHLDNLKNNAQVIRFATVKIDENGNKTSDVYKHPEFELSTDFLFRETRSSLSEYIFKKDQIDSIGFKDFPLAWFSDILAVLEFSDFKLIYTINTAVVFIRISEESISGKQDNYKLKNNAAFLFYFHLISFFANKFNSGQRQIILSKLNKSYINDKNNFRNFIKISFFYFKEGLFGHYLKFLKAVFLSFFK